MTIEITTNEQAYTGNGVTPSFDFDFPYFNASEITVYHNGVALNTDDYTLTRNPSGPGGTITPDTIPSSSIEGLIVRTVPYTQTARIPTVDEFTRGLIENAFDKVTMLCQQLYQASLRTLSFPITVSLDDVTPVLADPPGARRSLMIEADGTFSWSDIDPDEVLDDLEADINAAAAAASSASSSASAASSSASAASASAAAAAASAASAAAITTLSAKGDLLSHNGTANVRVAVGTDGKYLVADSAQTSGLKWETFPTIPTLGFPTGYMQGPPITYVSASTVQIPTGFRCRNSTDSADMVVPSNRSIVLSASGANGLDTGAEASNTWYYLYLIKKSSDGTIAGIFSVTNELVAGSITLPGGYDLKRQLPFAVRNDNSSNIIPFYMGTGGWMRPEVIYDTDFTGDSTNDPTTIGGGTLSSAAFAAVDASAYIPTGISRIGKFHFEKNTTENVYFRPGSSSLTSGLRFRMADNTLQEFDMRVNASGQIEYKVGGGNIELGVRGFVVTEVY